MPYFLCWCLLLGSFGIVLSGNLIEEQIGEENRKWLDDHTELVRKYLGKEMEAYTGMSFNLFPNVPVDKDISVYVNGKENSRLIARLQIGNGLDRAHWWFDPEYSSKIDIILYENVNIWLCNIQRNDSGKYYVVYGVSMSGPKVHLTVLDAMEDNHPEVCWRSHPNFTEKYFGKLTEVQIGEEIRKWLDDHPEYVRKYLGYLTEEQIGEEIKKWLDDHPEYIKKYLGKVTPEQILQMLCNHQREVLEEPNGSWNSLTTGLLLATCILTVLCIVLLYIVLINKNHIRIGWISWKHLIHDRPSSQHRRSENCSQIQKTAILIEETEILTNDQTMEQMQKCLDAYQMLIARYFEKFTEDQIWERIKKWQDVYPRLFMKKLLGTLKENQVHKWLNDHPEFLENYPDQSGIVPTYLPTLKDLAVTTHDVDNEMENDQSPFMGQENLTNPIICSNSSSEQPDKHKLPLTPVDAGTERKTNQGQLVSSKVKLVTSQTGISPNSDQPENNHQVFTTAHSQLSLTPVDARTERKDNQMKWISSEDKLVTSQTGICPNSDTFSEPGHSGIQPFNKSGIQPFNKDEQDANPEGDMAQTDVKSLGVLVKEDSDSLSDEESRELLRSEAKI